MTSEDAKKFQVSLSTMRWFDAQGGHLEDEGIFLDQNKNPIVDSVPQHRHHVVLNIYRVDLGLKYILGTN